MPQRKTFVLGLGSALLAIAAVGLVNRLARSANGLQERLGSQSSSLILALLVILMVIGAIVLGRLAWRSTGSAPASSPLVTDVILAATSEADRAEGVIRQVKDESIKAELNRELGEMKTGRDKRDFRVVIFGTGSAGKTSLINALLGRDVGKTEAILGTTKRAESHTYSLEGVDGYVFLTDTPGLSEIGTGGAAREQEARGLAARADLLIFVLDHDLIRTEFEPLSALVRQGKRSIVLLNKTDRFSDEDRNAILAKLKERLRGLVPAEDIVPGAADPRPIPVRVRRDDGSTETTLEDQPPDLAALRDRIAWILKRDGDSLRAGNLLLRAQLLGRKAQDQIAVERDRRAEAVIEKYQWMTAATVFTTPFPALELLASGAVQFQMISELADVYGVTLATSNVRLYGTEMIQTLLKLGLVEASTSLIAGIFKSTLVGYAAGGAVQAVSMAYLTHISGETFAEYFRRGQTWGDGGLQGALIHQFDQTSRAGFLQEFAQQAVQKVSSRFLPGSSKTEESPASRN